MPTILSIVPEDFSAERTIISTDGVKYLRTEKIKFNEILIPIEI